MVIVIGFSFVFHGLRGLRDLSRPITERSKAKSKQWKISLDP